LSATSGATDSSNFKEFSFQGLFIADFMFEYLTSTIDQSLDVDINDFVKLSSSFLNGAYFSSLSLMFSFHSLSVSETTH